MELNYLLNENVRGQPFDSTTIKKVVKKAIELNPKFKNFIKENHVYGRYIKNVTKKILDNNEPKTALNRSIAIIASSSTNGYIINSTLCWMGTNEGHEFWRKIYINSSK